MIYRNKLTLWTLLVTSLLFMGCSSVKPVAPLFSKDWLTLPPGTIYTNSSPQVEHWASEGIIREKDQAIHDLLEAVDRAEGKANTAQ
jgi:hypothetical protein